jgi:lipoic acid synthetase
MTPSSSSSATEPAHSAKPSWLKVRLGQGPNYRRLENTLHTQKLHTVCEEAKCPNRGQCWESGKATIMILGDTCTRSCGFCNVKTGAPSPVDLAEPGRVVDAVRAMDLDEVVITSVDRDELPDGGAGVWAETIRRLHDALPELIVEVLTPDFKGVERDIVTVTQTRPEVFSHNVETVASLHKSVRPQARYERSLSVLSMGHREGLIVKTALMVGHGETYEEMLQTLRDIRATGCDIISIGQYLQPTREHLPVCRYVEPAEFDAYQAEGLAMGFPVVISAPLVRSSFHSPIQSQYVRSRLNRPGSTHAAATHAPNALSVTSHH